MCLAHLFLAFLFKKRKEKGEAESNILHKKFFKKK